MPSPSRAVKTPWKSFVPLLEPVLSESPIPAALPADVAIVPPSPDLPAATARWSGEWLGWGAVAMSLDVRLAVESLSSDGADIAFARADGSGTSSERLHARFEDDELRGTLANGVRIAFRMRDADTLELQTSGPDGGWMCGVLARTDPDATRSVERVPGGFVDAHGERTLEAVVFRPAGSGPHPTLLFNHGSTGDGTDPERFGHTWTSLPLARFFTTRGWTVAFPQRSGRGKSDGVYDEGMKPSGNGYSTNAKLALAGVDHALEDIDAIVGWALADERVDVDRLVLGGQSRGGALAIAYAGQRPGTFAGVINVAGGWLGDRAASAARVNHETFERGAASEASSLWLYADGDSFYSLAHSRDGFAAFERAGGRGTFHVVPLPDDRDGHRLVHVPEAWGGVVDGYLGALDE